MQSEQIIRKYKKNFSVDIFGRFFYSSMIVEKRTPDDEKCVYFGSLYIDDKLGPRFVSGMVKLHNELTFLDN